MDNDSCEIQEENYVCYDLELAWFLDIYMENWTMQEDASVLLSFFMTGHIHPKCQLDLIPLTDPWDWYIYLHEWLKFMVNVGTYTIHGS